MLGTLISPATNFGLGAVIEVAGLAYLFALPSFFGVIAVDNSTRGA